MSKNQKQQANRNNGRPNKKKNAKLRVPRRQGRFPGVPGRIGRALGQYAAGGLGGEIGQKAGDYFGRISGLGAYTLRRNDLLTSNGPPAFDATNEYIEVTHREYVRDVVVSAAFTSNVDYINPGNAALFPWLSELANSFETYEFRGLVFEFKTTSASAVGSTNTALGTVVMATQYDVLSPDFPTKQAMEAYKFCVSTVPCDSVIHPVECDPRDNVLSQLYISRPVEVVSESRDLRFHHLGKLQVATSGSQATSTAGELWVSYKVRLFKPRLSATLLGHNHYGCSAPTTALPFGTFLMVYPENTISLDVSTDGDITFPELGEYTILWYCEATTLTTTGTTLVSGSRTMATAGYWYSTSDPYIMSGNGTGLLMYKEAFRINTAGTVINFGATITTGLNADLIISRIPQGSIGPLDAVATVKVVATPWRNRMPLKPHPNHSDSTIVHPLEVREGKWVQVESKQCSPR